MLTESHNIHKLKSEMFNIGVEFRCLKVEGTEKFDLSKKSSS